MIPGKVVTLLDLLRFYAENYVRVSHCVAQISAAITVNDLSSKGNDLAISALGLLDGIRPQCQEMGLDVSVKQIDRINEIWNLYHDKTLLPPLCEELLRRIADELRTRVLFCLRPGVQEFFTDPRREWIECMNRWPQTIDNVEEMGKCFALSRYPAAVFHSLLIVEIGIIELGTFIGVTDPKRGWDATTKKLKALIDGGHKNLPANLSGQFTFLEQVNACVEAMKHAWRNKVSHIEGKLVVLSPNFTPDTAEEIMIASRGFMRRLATEMP